MTRIFLIAFAVAFSLHADVSLPAVLGDHMVLQRGVPVHIWGKAAPSEAVSVSFAGNTASATADSIGLWSLYLPPVEAGGPFEVTIKGNNTIMLQDVLVGDVWVASGQSNMEFGLRDVDNGKAEVAAANRPRIRLFHVKNSVASYPLDDIAVRAPWSLCSPETVPSFSAVAYFFGRDLQDKLGVPIGLIDTSWGGTPVDSWASLRAISSDASLMPVFSEWNKMNEDSAVSRVRRDKELKDWNEAVTRSKAEGKPAPPFPWKGNDAGEWAPAALYNAMIAPLTKYPIRGAIWYQGESNASTERAGLYNRLFEAMIKDWRRAWGVGEFPFLFVQLANFKTSPDSRWPELREAQLKTLSLAKTGMAVIIDIGNPTDIHPKNKQDVGHRLALAARAIGFGENVVYSGPIFREAVPEGSSMRVWFDHVGGGLTAKGGDLRTFEIAGADRKFAPAAARIDGPTVVVSSAGVTGPMYVRYGWSDNPDCNLYNAEGLPASPFRSRE